MYRAYQTNLVDKKLLSVSVTVNVSVQTDSVKVFDSYIVTDATTTAIATASYINIDSPAKRCALHSISSDDNTPWVNNNTIEMPLICISFSRCYCFVCNTGYSKSSSRSFLINEIVSTKTLFTHGIVIRNGSTRCEKHLDKNQFEANAIASIKKNKLNIYVPSRDELLNSPDDLNIAYRQRQSMLDEANRTSSDCL